MTGLQSGFIIMVILVLLYLLLNGLVSGSVWVKGNRSGIANFRQWAHKRERLDEPFSYWSAMVFYAIALVLITWLLLASADF